MPIQRYRGKTFQEGVQTTSPGLNGLTGEGLCSLPKLYFSLFV